MFPSPARLYDAVMTTSQPATSVVHAGRHRNARLAAAASHTPSADGASSFGEHLRFWRRHRRLSQQGLALEAEVSTRHLSYVETGRSLPSREMVMRLAGRLNVPLRERNALLVAAGYAPMYRERVWSDATLAPAHQAVALILKSHEPYPALAIDRHWILVCANRMLPHLLEDVDPSLLQGQVNVLRLSLHPLGLAPRIVNLGQWRNHIFERLRQQIHATGDSVLTALLEELRAYPVVENAGADHLDGELLGVVMPFRLRTRHGVLSFISTTTVFGTPVDITLRELALETFFPADAVTGEVLRGLQPRDGGSGL